MNKFVIMRGRYIVKFEEAGDRKKGFTVSSKDEERSRMIGI